MNNPFDYEPSPQMLEAQARLVEHIQQLASENPRFAEETARGKMFGILLLEPATSQHESLFAFSGQIDDSFDWPGFVPPVFDYLDQQGYFKVHERQISAINHEITQLEQSQELAQLRSTLLQQQQEAERDIEQYRNLMKAAKAERNLIRGKGLVSEADLIRESQFMKAELHRKKHGWKVRIAETEGEINGHIGRIRSLKLQRQQQSDALQRWLFEQFHITNNKGEQRSLTQIFAEFNRTAGNRSERLLQATAGNILPPSGAGECCEPKLLNYAYAHRMTPKEIGMFWWGESPRQEIRHHLQFYPACNGKCRPLLSFILDTATSNHTSTSQAQLETIYEDEALIVVNKPAGLLSVPGKGSGESVFSLLKTSHPYCPELQMVHRLDMDTSGLLVVAKTKTAHKSLQQQFAQHTNKKVYVALLEQSITGEGDIELKLRPDYNDRPRQIVDDINGKTALTHYRSLGGNRVELTLSTGRTHQLRVHCAHQQGLNSPILGDRLYGKKGPRLYLHAYTLAFRHPTTEEQMCFHAPPDW